MPMQILIFVLLFSAVWKFCCCWIAAVGTVTSFIRFFRDRNGKGLSGRLSRADTLHGFVQALSRKCEMKERNLVELISYIFTLLFRNRSVLVNIGYLIRAIVNLKSKDEI